MATATLENHDGLLMHGGRCLGYVFVADSYGAFAPDGRVEITAETADAHNRILSRGEIAGLDTCEVGQCGTLYAGKRDGRMVVHTWIGELVSADTSVSGRILTFRRNGKVFRGRLCKDAGCFNFRRIK